MSQEPVNIPTVAELIQDPAKAMTLPPEAAKALWLDLITVEKTLAMRAMTVVDKPHLEDRLLTVEQAADILSKTTDWLYRRAKILPFTVREGRSLRFSHNGIQKYIQARMRH